MPVFEIEANGKTYEVEAPDQTAALSAIGKVGSPQAQSGTAEDVVKSAGTGVAEGLIGLAGLPRALGDLGQFGADKITDFILGDETPEQEAKAAALDSITPMQAVPSADMIKKGVESVTGEFYKPQTTAGEFARTIGEFVPGGIAAAPRKAVSSAIKFGALPGAASEAAGQATEGTDLEPYARVAAALGTGMGVGAATNRVTRSMANRDLMKSAPTRADLQRRSRAAYQTAENAGVIVPPQTIQRLGNDMVSAATQSGFRPRNHPKLAEAFQSLYEDGGMPQPLDRLELSRRVILGVTKSADADEARLAREALELYDDAIDTLGPQDILAGDPQIASQAYKQARELWKRNKKAELLEEAGIKAEDRAASTGSGGNLDNATRQNVRKLLDNPRTRKMFSKEEQDALREVVRSGSSANLLRMVGKLSPQGSGLMTALGVGGTVINPLAAVPFAAGAAAKPVADALTKRNLAVVDALVRSGGQRRRNLPVPYQNVIGALMASSQPLRSPE